jgi:phosphatidate cytidylyltransferase
MWDPRTWGLIGGVLLLLGAASAVVAMLQRREDLGVDAAVFETFRRRVRAWWVLCTVLAAAFLLGQWVTVILFGLISFWALREFITLTPTRPGDHRTLFWVFFLFTPLQFFLVGMESYSLFSIAIPVYAFLFIPARNALAGDHRRFLERTAKIQAGLLICVYCLSYAPALLTLDLKVVGEWLATARSLDAAKTEELVQQWTGWGPKARLLFFFVLISQLSDALLYAWSQIPSKHVIVPAINPNKTWEGLLGGTLSVTLIGSVLWWATPFQGANWWMAGAMSAVIAVMGFAGAITMSAIKRDRGVKDYGTLVEGHGGVLDRLDSLCFAAPVFFHLTYSWLQWMEKVAAG